MFGYDAHPPKWLARLIYSTFIKSFSSYFFFLLNCENNFEINIMPFHAIGFFLYPLKTSENLWFSNVFKGYRNKPIERNGLTLYFAMS